MRCIFHSFRDLAEKVKMGLVIPEKDAKHLNNVVNSIVLVHLKDDLGYNFQSARSEFNSARSKFESLNLSKQEVNLNVDSDAVPVFCKARTVPVRL